MKTLMYRMLIIGLLILLISPCMAEDSPGFFKAGVDFISVKDLLEKPSNITKIDQGTTLAEALRKFSPEGIKSWPTTRGAENQLQWSISQDAQLLPLPEMKLDKETVNSAIDKIIAAADAQYIIKYDDNFYLAHITVSRKVNKDLSRLVYFEFSGTTLDSALQSIISSTGMNYVISPELGSLQVNAKLKGVSISTALSALLRAVGADYEISSNIINIKVSPEKNNAIYQSRVNQQAGFQGPGRRGAEPAPTTSLGLADTISANRAVTAEKQDKVVSKNIDLKYANASDIAPIISNQGVDVMSTNSRKVVVTGPESQVTQALNLAQSVDNDSYLPKPVRILFSVKTLYGPKGKLMPMNVISPEIFTFDGQQASVDINSTNGAMNIRGTITATPAILPNGAINLAGSFRCELKRMDLKNNEMSNSPEISFKASLAPGSEQTVAGIKNEAPQTGEITSIELTAVASVEGQKVFRPVPPPPAAPGPRSNTGVIKKRN